jgi:hypothetical protein
MCPIGGYIQTTMGHFWTVASHNKNAIINTSRLKYKKVFLYFSTGRRKNLQLRTRKNRNLSHVQKAQW